MSGTFFLRKNRNHTNLILKCRNLNLNETNNRLNHRACSEPYISIDPRIEVLNQDPAEEAGLVQLTILSASYRLLKIEFH